MEPITLEVSSALGTGNGTIETEPGKPNINTVVIPWWEITLARGMDAFVTTLLSVATVGGSTGIVPAKDLVHLFWSSASMALGASLLALLYDGQKQLRKFIASHP